VQELELYHTADELDVLEREREAFYRLERPSLDYPAYDAVRLL